VPPPPPPSYSSNKAFANKNAEYSAPTPHVAAPPPYTAAPSAAAAIGASAAATAAATKRAPPPPPPLKPKPAAPSYVVALFDFAAQADGDLDFKVGDRIEVIERTESAEDWWKGSLNGREGVFPGMWPKSPFLASTACVGLIVTCIIIASQVTTSRRRDESFVDLRIVDVRDNFVLFPVTERIYHRSCTNVLGFSKPEPETETK
jgi:hypothetical protein